MISKKIHYIWLGSGKMNNTSQMCINSWKRNLKDYEIIRWDEESLNLKELLQQNTFLSKCYELKLWAFVADYLRLYILYNYGGIYLDTDVEVLKDFDQFLKYECFMGYEGYDGLDQIGTGTIGAVKGNHTIKALLDFYETEIWNVDYFINPIIFRKLQLKKPESFKGCTVFPRNVFSPFDPHEDNEKKKMIGDDNTVCIHWYNANWGMSRKGYVFLTTKHIKNPFMRELISIKRNIGYVKQKIK